MWPSICIDWPGLSGGAVLIGGGKVDVVVDGNGNSGGVRAETKGWE